MIYRITSIRDWISRVNTSAIIDYFEVWKKTFPERLDICQSQSLLRTADNLVTKFPAYATWDRDGKRVYGCRNWLISRTSLGPWICLHSISVKSWRAIWISVMTWTIRGRQFIFSMIDFLIRLSKKLCCTKTRGCRLRATMPSNQMKVEPRRLTTVFREQELSQAMNRAKIILSEFYAHLDP